MPMDTSISIFKLATKCQLPRTVDGSTSINLRVFKELYKARLVEAIDVSDDEGDCYLDPAITTAGREHLSRTLPLISNVEAVKKGASGTTFALNPEKEIATMARYKPQDHNSTPPTGWLTTTSRCGSSLTKRAWTLPTAKPV